MFDQILPKVVCLTLNNSRARQQLVVGEFERIGINHYQFFPGYNAESEAVKAAYEEDRVKRYPPCFRCGKFDCGDPDCNNVLIPAQVAVCLGFQAIFRFLAYGESNVYAICEDDIVFTDYAADVLKSSRFAEILCEINIHTDEPVLLRMSRPEYDASSFNRKVLLNDLAVTRDIVMSNYFFIANRAFAMLAYKRFQYIDHTADVIIHELLTTSASCWTLNYQLVADRSWSMGEIPSLIHPKRKYLDSLAQNTSSYEQEHQRVIKHKKKVLHRKYCIIGSPRCGSHFVSTFLNKNGLQVGHESLGDAGICAWQYTVSDDDYPYIKDNYASSHFFVHFEQLLLYTRNPITAIPSLIVENQKAPLSYEFRRRHILKHFGISLDDYPNPIEQAALVYALWNSMALDRKPQHILRVESMLEDCSIAFTGHEFEMHEITDFEKGRGKPYLGYVYNPKPLEEDWLKHLSQSTRAALSEVCSAFGYQIGV